MLTIKLAGSLEFESRLTVLETVVLPVGRTPYKMVVREGIEPPTYTGYSVYSGATNRLSYAP